VNKRLGSGTLMKKRSVPEKHHDTRAQHRMFKNAFQRGRSERRYEAYPCGTLSL
jgi:hypothetical protein